MIVSLTCLIKHFIVPDEFKDRLKTSELGKELNIEQKMSLREKQKAKKRAEEEEERALYEQAGIRDKSKDFTMENLIKKYQHDIERHEKKLEKIKALEKKGVSNYDIDDIKLSDDENEKGEYFERMAEERMRKSKEYQDEPYKAQEEEKNNFEKQYEHIEQKLEAIRKAGIDGESITSSESENFKHFEEVMDGMDRLHDMMNFDQIKEEQEELQRDEMKEFDRLYRQERDIKESFYSKRQQKE